MNVLRTAWQAFAAIVIWILLILVVNVGLVSGLLSLLMLRTDYISRVFRATDRAAAAVFGYSGTNTVSRECGLSSCRGCKVLCAFLGVWLAQPDHCEKEAA